VVHRHPFLFSQYDGFPTSVSLSFLRTVFIIICTRALFAFKTPCNPAEFVTTYTTCILSGLGCHSLCESLDADFTCPTSTKHVVQTDGYVPNAYIVLWLEAHPVSFEFTVNTYCVSI